MKSYKDYEKKYIGMSDIANLILAGSSDNGLKLAVLHFGMDNDYYAYIVDADAEIGEHYTKVAEFKSWLRIYDDSFLTQEFIVSIVQEKWDASSSYLSKKIRRIKLWQRKSSMEECITQIPQRY